uniref:Protein CCSMST1 n=1 Tax=Geotrypetes seraphini TaxID=260995 RepID=A0A6P8N5D2_GEOSA|nr:protein CCSMST1 [Geotrypetes seraphini]
MRWNLYRVLGLRSVQASSTKPVVRRIHENSNQPSPEDKEDSTPIPFSTSKGSHRVWTVARSFGSDHQRPLWQALSVSFLSTALLLWCVFREETELDKALFSITELPERGTAEEVHSPNKET